MSSPNKMYSFTCNSPLSMHDVAESYMPKLYTKEEFDAEAKRRSESGIAFNPEPTVWIQTAPDVYKKAVEN
jgi:hypothetical protein